MLRRDVAVACRVLAFAGLAADVLGHVSVRVGEDRLLVRCRGPQESGPRKPGVIRQNCLRLTWPSCLIWAAR